MNILITGGASGLGEAITKMLVKDSSNKVYFTYSKSGVNAKEIESKHKNAHSIKCDFNSRTEVNELIGQISDFDLDILINNAYSGEFLKNHFQKIKSHEFLDDFRDNIIPTIEITQNVIAGFRKKKMGKIITVLTSALVNNPPIGSSVYIANKAYIKMLTKVWAYENSKFNITSNSISPAFMQTNLTANFDDRIIEQMVSGHPLKKLLTVDEVAESVVFLVNASNQINGVDLIMNAGLDVK